MKPRKRVQRVCEQCRQDYMCRTDMPSQRFCSRRCKADWAKAQPRQHTPQHIRRLRDDEPLPTTEPSRYVNGNGYVVLRWKVGVRDYVEAFEHRVVTGRMSPEVHHINGVKDDNRPENLRPVTSTEHGAHHAKWDIDEACRLYLEGMSLPDLQRRYHASTVQIMRSLKLRGVRMRTPQEAWVLRKQRQQQ